MVLSIFNSKHRVMQTLLAVVIITIPLALLNIVIHLNLSRSQMGADAEEKFWQHKIRPPEKYGIVFSGDSRVLVGIDPKPFETALNCKAYNAAFSAGSVNEVIYRHLDDNFLNKSSKGPKAVVIGMTPLTMAESSRDNALFEESKRKLANLKSSKISKYVDILFSKLRWKHVKALFKKPEISKIYHSNGFLERFAKVRKKSQQSSIRTYIAFFDKYQFSEKSLQETIDRIRSWKKENITVFVFRPPVNAEMDQLEDNTGKINFAHIRKKIEAAGGVWLDVADRGGYVSYDSSHLASNEAKRLSENLAAKIAEYYRRRQ